MASLENAELDALNDDLRRLSVAVLSDRLYILGSDQWADPELVYRWHAEVTPGTVLQLLNAITALRHDVERHIQIAAEQATEIEQLRALLREAQQWLTPDRDSPLAMDELWNHIDAALQEQK